MRSSPGSLYAWFQRTARRFPDATALEVGGEQFSYAALDGLAERVAAMITMAAGAPHQAVGLYCSRSVAAYAAYLGTLRAGAAVVPLNAAFPPARNQAMCQAAGVGVIITDDLAGSQCPDVSAEEIRLAGSWWRSEPPSGVPAPPHRTRPQELAYVLFTSGSTGRPKGVPVRHRQLADYLAFCAERYSVGPGSRVSQTFDLTFDPSIFDMFVTWHTGAALVVPEREEILTPARFVEQHRISHWFSVPSSISLAGRLHGLRPNSMPHLRWSLFAGEQLTLDQAREWAAAAPAAAIENLYGPTELTITCTSYRLPRLPGQWPRTSNGTVPIGRPYPHLEATVLGEDGADGCAGELCVRGSQRFDGYLDPADNQGHFLRPRDHPQPTPSHPAAEDWYRTGDRVSWQEGELVHLGRLDEQVKVGGYRVEPTEIECVLRGHPDVREVVVLAVGRSAGHTELHALYTGRQLARQDLISHAQRWLPGYMMPTHIRYLGELPLSSNGKIDRSLLRALVIDGELDRPLTHPAVIQSW